MERKDKRLTIAMSANERQQLTELAQRQGRSMGSMIRMLLRAGATYLLTTEQQPEQGQKDETYSKDRNNG